MAALSVCKEELPPEQQELSPSLGQEEPEPPHIKEEEEEFNVKREYDEERAQWSQLHQWQTEKREAEPFASTSTEQMETEVDPEDPAAALEPSGAEQLFSSHCSEPETEDGDGGWKETTEPPSAVKTHGFSCPGCRFSFSSQLFLHKHIKRSHSEIYIQQLRSGEIKAESLLPSAASQPIGTSGTTRAQKGKPGNNSCNQCGKTFRWPCHLREHETIHTGERSFHCDLCEKTCNTKDQLKVHQRIHSGEKPYKCLQCAKCFRTKGDLNRHQLIHTGERSYHCEQCGKGFSIQSQLTVHQRCHTGEKPYNCQQCGKSYNVKRDLDVHQRIHTGERPYKCLQCDKSFRTKVVLERHQLIHTGEKPYHCQQCGKRFNTKANLNRHQRVHTGE